MSALKCIMCGGNIIINENQTYGTCDSCGITLALPMIKHERSANKFNCANRLRIQNDFDKASSANECSISEDDADNAADLAPSLMSLYERGRMLLEVEDWKNARIYFNRVLDINPKFVPGYVGILCVQTATKTEADLVNAKYPLDLFIEFQHAIQFADDRYRATLNCYNQTINERLELEEQKDKYERAIEHMDRALNIGKKFDINIGEDPLKQNKIKISYYTEAKNLFDSVWLYQEAKVKSLECVKLIGELKVIAERLAEQERLADEEQRLLHDKIRLMNNIRDKRKRVLRIVFSLLFVAFWVLLVIGVGQGWFL